MIQEEQKAWFVPALDSLSALCSLRSGLEAYTFEWKALYVLKRIYLFLKQGLKIPFVGRRIISIQRCPCPNAWNLQILAYKGKGT